MLPGRAGLGCEVAVGCDLVGQRLLLDRAGIVLGARVPVVLTSRADSRQSRLASCAIAVMLAQPARA